MMVGRGKSRDSFVNPNDHVAEGAVKKILNIQIEGREGSLVCAVNLSNLL